MVAPAVQAVLPESAVSAAKADKAALEELRAQAQQVML
jgi:hypothetical protein